MTAWRRAEGWLAAALVATLLLWTLGQAFELVNLLVWG
jgi:hypothetical protein